MTSIINQNQQQAQQELLQLQQQQLGDNDGDNSDLEVVDVVAAKPPRKPSTSAPEVVELSDSDGEDEIPAPTVTNSADDDIILVISSDDDQPSTKSKSGQF